MTCNPCKCGAGAKVWNDYCTSKGHGYIVFCMANDDHAGWHAKTRNGAISLWNKINASSLSIEEITMARMIPLTVAEAIRRKEAEHA